MISAAHKYYGHVRDCIENLRTCCFCGQIKWNSYLLCDYCAHRFEQNRASQVVSSYESQVITLFTWNRQNENLIRTVLMALKGGHPEKAFANFASQLLMQSIQREGSREDKGGSRLRAARIFVPAPGSREFGGGLDHAEQLAYQLAQCSGLGSASYFPCLERLGPHMKAHKRMRREERKRENLQLVPGKISELQNLQRATANQVNIVFVDDVITSGGTADAAYRALGRPKNFEIWTIFHRPRLRE